MPLYTYTITHSHTPTHSLSLVLVVMMKSKELKTKISLTHSLIPSLPLTVGSCQADDQRGLPSLRVEQFKYQNQAANLVCVVCKQVPVNEWEPLELRCKHLFCWGCLKNALGKAQVIPLTVLFDHYALPSLCSTLTVL